MVVFPECFFSFFLLDRAFAEVWCFRICQVWVIFYRNFFSCSGSGPKLWIFLSLVLAFVSRYFVFHGSVVCSADLRLVLTYDTERITLTHLPVLDHCLRQVRFCSVRSTCLVRAMLTSTTLLRCLLS